MRRRARPCGRLQHSAAHQRAEIVRRAEQDFELDVFGMRLAMDNDGAQAALDKRAKRLKAQERAELLEGNALLIIDLNEKKVTLGAPYGPRKKWPIGSSSGAADRDGDDKADASGGDGKPDPGGTGADPGSSSIDTSGTGSSSAGGNDAGSGSESDDGSAGNGTVNRDVAPVMDTRADS